MQYVLFISRALIVVLCFFATGCATMLHGTRQRVAVASDPPGAVVSDGEVSIETPANLDLKRDRDYILTITKPGFEAESVKVSHVISGAVVANLIIPGGIIGWGIDNSSGALYRLEPDTLSVTLRPLDANETIDGGKRPSIATLAGKLEELSGLRDKQLITQDEFTVMRKIAISSVAS
jgi:hypothetical protein